MVNTKRLRQLYKKGWLSETELVEYSALRKDEYLTRKAKLLEEGATNVKAVKGNDDDIVGWTWDGTSPTE